jgi:ethanolamine utilization protein EutA (predicted chaperonin)
MPPACARRPTNPTSSTGPAPSRWRSRGPAIRCMPAALAAGICAAMPKTLAAKLPLVLLIDGDVGMSLGRIIHHETAPGANVIVIDGVQLKRFDYVDIGSVIESSNVVIVIIKSLLFK